MKKIIVLFSLFIGAIFSPGALLAANNAEFISQNVPQTMTAGQTYQVSVAMKNTGTTAWTEADKFRLGSQNPQDNWIWREGRVYLAAGEEIAPGQTKTFNFDVKAPATPGAYNFQWRMVQEGVEWFGQISSNIVVNVIAGQVEIPLTGDLFDYAVFAGANVLERSTCWVPDENEADVIIKSAKKMRLRVLRLPILSQLADNADCWGLVNIKNFLDKADENGLKVIVVLNGYTKYEGYCGWQAGFVDVKDGAAKIVSALKNHPALFAWDLLNEPLWGADNSGCGSVADHQSTIKAVNAMHDLVRSIDSKTPLTVGEGKDEYLSQWNGIVNFASPHMYFGSSRMYTTGNEFRNRLDYCKSQVKNLPMVLGEFGLVVPDQATEEERAQVFGEIYRTLKQYNMGSMFWLLSTDEGNQGTMSLINANGSLKPTAEVVRQSFPSYNSVRFVSQTVPQTMTAGQTYQASIIMKNTGKTAWVEADKFRLGSQNPQDNWIWREGRVHLAVGESIAPGQTKTFNFDVKAPATPGT
ncbi:MAG TPA: NBR1-Ig-like domain-containing protein, partial [Candidatus Pacearchaeota archaeon]|nr:NBR1-Ig-like domain-containing protein [Candidatus Pacearchaeota archaeon]